MLYSPVLTSVLQVSHIRHWVLTRPMEFSVLNRQARSADNGELYFTLLCGNVVCPALSQLCTCWLKHSTIHRLSCVLVYTTCISTTIAVESEALGPLRICHLVVHTGILYCVLVFALEIFESRILCSCSLPCNLKLNAPRIGPSRRQIHHSKLA